MKIQLVKGAIASLVLFTLGSVPAFSQNLGGEIITAAEMILPDSIDGIEYFRTDNLVVNELSVIKGELQLAHGLKVTGDGDFRGDVLVAGKLTVAGNPYFTGLNESVEVPGVVGMNDVGELVYIATETLLGGTPGTTDPSTCARDTDGQIISQPAKWSYNNNDIFTNPCTVNPQVGIGTHTPRKSLDVIGSGIFTGDLAVGRSTTRGGLDVQGKAYFGDNSKFVEIGCDGANAYINAQSPTGELLLNYFNNSDVKIGANGAAQGPADLYVAGNTTIGHTLRIGDYSFYNGTTQHATLELGDASNFIKNTRNKGVQIAAYGNSGLMIANGGGIGMGLGNFTPQAHLHIKSNAGLPAIFLIENGDNAEVFKIKNDNKVYAQEINVQTAPFPDYVFKADYALPSLNEVQQHISKEGRLPGMPSAEEVEKEGMDVGEMNRLLVEKVEELTLYLLQQQAQLEKQQAEIEALREQMNR